MKRITLRLIILFICTLSYSITVGAEELDTLIIGRVEVLGSRLTSKGRGSFEVDSLVYSRAMSSTLGELLRDATPVVVKDYGRGQRQSISFRGASSTHTSLYWNSLKINSPVIGDVDFSLFPAIGFDGLSVAPGVSAIAYGDGALGGVVNMQSMANWDDNFALDIIGTIGSFSTYNALVSLRAGSESFQSSTKVIYNSSLNDFEFINRDIIDPMNPSYRPTQRNLNGDYRNVWLVQDFFVNLGHNEELSASVMLSDNMRNLPQLTTYEGPENSNLTNSQESSIRAVLNYTRSWDSFKLGAMLGGTLEESSFLQQNYMGSNSYESYISSESLGRTLQAKFNVDYNPSLSHRLSFRAEGSIHSAESYEAVRETGFSISRGEFAVGLDWSAWWGDKFSSSAFGRVGMVGSDLYGTGSLAVNYVVSSAFELFVRGGYNQHFPTLQDLYYTPGGNAELKPERGLTSELGGRYIDRNLRVTVNLFSSFINDWIVWLPTHAQYWTPSNLNQVLSLGVEAQLGYSYRFSDTWRVDFSGTANLSRTVNIAAPIGSNDYSKWQQLPFVPLLSGAATIGLGWREFVLGYSVEGESGKYSAMSANPASLSQIEPYVIHSISLSYSFIESFVFGLQCNNLYDSRFYGIMRRPMPPRSFTLSLKYTL